MLDCQLFGVNPAWHHFSSVVIHALATIALFFALDSLTGKTGEAHLSPVSSPFIRYARNRWLGSPSAKTFSAVYSSRLTLLAWSYYARRKSVTRYLLAVLAAALGTLSKPMLVTIPFVLLLIDYWPLNRFRKEKSFGCSWRKFRSRWSPQSRRSPRCWPNTARSTLSASLCRYDLKMPSLATRSICVS